MTLFLRLFWSFCKIGFTSFGGLSMIPLINSEMISNSWMTAEEISDIVAIAEMPPGPLGLNCATFAGMRVGSIIGAFAANLGIIAPTLTVCALAAIFFEKFKKSRAIKNMMLGVRPAAIGLIWAVIMDLCHTNYLVNGAPQITSLLIGAGACLMLIKFKVSIPITILAAAVCGVLFIR